MKKILITIISLLAFSIQIANAQQSTFAKGYQTLNVGLGIGGTIYSDGYKMLVPPISAAYEYCVASGFINNNASIGVGGYTAFAASRYKFNGNHVDRSHFILGARGTFHYEFVPLLDTYAGLMLGYDIDNTSGRIDGRKDTDDNTGFAYSGFIGVRYYFSPTVAGYAELGYGITYASIGATFRF